MHKCVHCDDDRRHVAARNDALDQSEAREVELSDWLATVERRKVEVHFAVVFRNVERVQLGRLTEIFKINIAMCPNRFIFHVLLTVAAADDPEVCTASR